jgi:hypothetical protein
MNQREKLLIGVIAGLALAVVVGFVTNFGMYGQLSTQNEKPTTTVLDAKKPIMDANEPVQKS